jgi:hypothetical protein
MSFDSQQHARAAALFTNWSESKEWKPPPTLAHQLFAPSGSGAGRCSKKRNQSADMATVFLLKKCHRRIRFFGVLQRQSHDQPPFAKTLPRSCDLISANRAASITRPRRKFTRSISLLRYMSQSGRCVDQHARSAKRRSAL